MSTMTDSQRQGLHHPFLSHLIALLSAYELCPMSTPPPRYDGPADWQTDTIIRSLEAVARRMYTAEEILASMKASECWQTNGPETKKGRSVGDTPMSSSSSSQKETNSSSSLMQSSTNVNAFAPSYSSPGPTSCFQTNSNLAATVESIDVADSTNGSMSLSLDELPAHIDAATLLQSFSNGSSASAPPTSHLECMACTTFDGSPNGSPLVVPPSPLAAATFESGMSAVEELRLLKAQVSDVARVCNAVARGDLSQKITVPVQGVVMVQLKDVINTMVDKLGQFAKEVTRVSQEVVFRSKLGGQALVLDVEGTQSRIHRSNIDACGEILDLKNTVNGMKSVIKASWVVKRTSQMFKVFGSSWFTLCALYRVLLAQWPNLRFKVNRMCSSLTDQVRSIANVTAAVARGDLTQKIEIQVEGEMSTLKGTVNSMVDQLSAFASEVTRVALEVGTQGILGGQARVEGVQGTWADLTRNVNKMASNLTDQGEMLYLKMTVNSMVAQLSTLANEVTRVSLEVGMEGILGGQAYVPDVQGMSAKKLRLTLALAKRAPLDKIAPLPAALVPAHIRKIVPTI
ncbi:hypothetical protein DFJ58DRAFT_742708 [Suillus subalutaceus]|uniref:uncharacterized protein n=1 Tax=Suillus subalutaceus TaxID=48586 RepID=UPI001B85BE49|nr:uncharacterized protein DFJ58DRAFT_742708 [Suillus subalutaceus]KAG1868348.1 hypothetical protein DFJ58DRAFT_742708 [Suillus subalutaceus]